jgi:hypothetical protein
MDKLGISSEHLTGLRDFGSKLTPQPRGSALSKKAPITTACGYTCGGGCYGSCSGHNPYRGGPLSSGPKPN